MIPILLLLFIAVLGRHMRNVVEGDDDDPLTLIRTSKPSKRRFLPGEPDEPVYEGPAWDLPGIER